MKERIFGLAIFAFALLPFGCNSNSGTVAVSAADGPPPAAAKPAVGKVQSGSSNGTHGAFKDSVYFERVLMRSGRILEMTGMGFLSPDSSTRESFAFGTTPVKFDGSLRLAPTLQGAVYAQAGMSSDVLVSMTESSLKKSEGIATGRNVSWLVSEGGTGNVAWIDETGAAMLYDGQSRSPLSLNLDSDATGAPSAHAKTIQFVETLKEVWVQTDQSEVLRFDAHGGGRALALNPSGKFAGDSAVADPSGSQAAVVTVEATGAASLNLQSLTAATADSAGHFSLQMTRASDLTWIASDKIVYRGITATGAHELHVLDLASSSESRVAALNAPFSEKGVTCPLWLGGKLYFADSLDSRFAIYRLDPARAEGTAELFTSPRDENEGLICPVAMVGYGRLQ